MSPSSAEVEQFEPIAEASGKLAQQSEEDKLMRSIVANDKQKIEEGKLIADAVNQGMGGFTPDLMLKNLVKNYKLGKKLYGEKLIRRSTGYDPDYISRNIKIPEFQKELKKRIDAQISNLRKDKLIDRDGSITEKGIELSSVVMYMEELDHLAPYGFFGEHAHKKLAIYGEKEGLSNFKKGSRYRDINLRASIRTSIKRGHKSMEERDLRISERKAKGNLEIIYALDASASMKGQRIEMGKKAGIALAYKAINEKNKVGLIVFGDDIKKKVPPSDNFGELLLEIARIKAANQTNIAKTIENAQEMFPHQNVSKHLMIITDALPTEGKDPAKDTLDSCYRAREHDITISVVGINLTREGKTLAEKMVEIGCGRLYMAKDMENLDILVLQDYLQEA